MAYTGLTIETTVSSATLDSHCILLTLNITVALHLMLLSTLHAKHPMMN